MVPHARVLQHGEILSADNRHRLERVLRLRPGDKFHLTDGEGRESAAILAKDGRFEVQQWVMPEREPALEVTLFAALPKGERFEWLIEKAVEMGVKNIVPLMSERVVVKKPDNKRLGRWQKIADTAMLQCGGCLRPAIQEPVTVDDIEQPSEDVLPVLLHEEALSTSLHALPEISGKKRLWLVSGPEGGFSDDEVQSFTHNKWQPVWLGRRLFKADTAPVIALANLLSNQWGT